MHNDLRLSCIMKKNMVYVTQPEMPPLGEFLSYLSKIWENKILTNAGPFHEELEGKLCDYLGVDHISLFSNGTLALVSALQALRITGEVITTPYSFVATAHSLLWNGIKPVFVDIDRNSLNINPSAIESAITPKTTAIMPVHCYGRPCDVDAIQKIADTYNLKVIYDAAHSFGVKSKGVSVLRHGDVSVLSFHATKVFNTFEGGAIICADAKMKKRIDYLKNFGFADETTVVAPGINGKMSEINAAFGLLQLNYIDGNIEKRKTINDNYIRGLSGVRGVSCSMRNINYTSNYSYFPIMIDESYGKTRDELYGYLKDNMIYARRYFYPLITDFPMYRGLPSANIENLPVAKAASNQVLCLPIYPALTDAEQSRIINLISGG